MTLFLIVKCGDILSGIRLVRESNVRRARRGLVDLLQATDIAHRHARATVGRSADRINLPRALPVLWGFLRFGIANREPLEVHRC